MLGVLGDANLFLINPNGIVLGDGAKLNVSGSFAATTADAIQFDEQGEFSASDAIAPSLLTVQPSAFLFNQIDPAPIANDARTSRPDNPDGAFGRGLQVADGQG